MKMSNDQWNTKMKIIIIKLLKRIKKKPVSFRSFPRKKKKKKYGNFSICCYPGNITLKEYRYDHRVTLSYLTLLYV